MHTINTISFEIDNRLDFIKEFLSRRAISFGVKTKQNSIFWIAKAFQNLILLTLSESSLRQIWYQIYCFALALRIYCFYWTPNVIAQTDADV